MHVSLLSADFFQSQLFQKIISRIPSQCQTVWIQIKPDILSGLIWVQTICKSYQQMTLVSLTDQLYICRKNLGPEHCALNLIKPFYNSR